MRPLALAERRVSAPTVSFGDLFQGSRPPLRGETDVPLDMYVREIVRSGFPGLRRLTDRASQLHLDGYLDRIVEHDFEEQGRHVRNPAALRRWMTAYAAAVSTTAAYETIRDASTAGHSDKPSRVTVQPYMDILERIWILEPVPAWLPSRNMITRLGSAPKHQLADPALAARLAGIGVDGLIDGQSPSAMMPGSGPFLGRLFEALVTLSVRVFAQRFGGHVLHLRTRGPNEHEVDIIVQRGDQRVLAIEVKLAATVSDDDIDDLLWLRKRIGEDLLDAVIVTTGRDAYRRSDGIGVVPAALLGP